jgi:ribulose-phosphate 3-epimerase
MILSPSILAADFSRIEQEINELDSYNVKWVHLDVMDGVFVPATTFGPELVARLRPITKMFFDVHLMIVDPKSHVKSYVDAGADLITFHYEAVEDNMDMINYIKSFGVKVGISIKPATPVKDIEALLPYLDLVLVMSVEPGKGGQSFIPNALNKIEELNKHDLLIEVDGGVNETTGKQCIDAGADVLVAGSFVFKDKENIKVLNSLDN